MAFDENRNSGCSYPYENDVTHKEKRINTSYDPNAIPGKSILKKTKFSFLSRMVTSIKNGLGRVGAAIIRGMQHIVSGVKGLCYYRAKQARSEESSVYGWFNSEEGESHQPEPKQTNLCKLSECIRHSTTELKDLCTR